MRRRLAPDAERFSGSRSLERDFIYRPERCDWMLPSTDVASIPERLRDYFRDVNGGPPQTIRELTRTFPG